MLKILTQSKNKNFLRLWVAQIISQFGDRIHQLALVALIAERAPGSTMEMAKILACTILPVFVIQPLAGVFVDRWDRRTILFVADLARGALVLLIPLIFIYWKSMIPIYVIVFCVFCFSRFYIPAKMSIIPDLVEEDNLMMANSLVSTTGMIAFVLGCALGGFINDWWGAQSGFVIDSATFFISALVVLSIALPRKIKMKPRHLIAAGREFSRELVGPIRKTVWEEIREGFTYLREHKEIRFIINMLFTLLSCAGAIYVVIIVFIQQSFHSTTKHLGVLAVCLGLGLFTGALLYGKMGRKIVWYKIIFFSLTIGGLMLGLFACMVYYFPNIYAAMIMAYGLGVVVGPIFIASNTMIHIVSDEHMRGKVFSALEIVIHFAFMLSMFISSWLSEFVPRVWILIGASIVFMFVGLGGLIRAHFGWEALREK